MYWFILGTVCVGKHVFWEGIPGHGYREDLYRGKMGVGGPQEWCLRFWPEKPVKDNVIHRSRGQWGRGGAEREEYLLLWSRAEYVQLSRGSWLSESGSQNMSLEPLRLIAKGSLSHLGMSRSNVGIDWPFSLPHFSTALFSEQLVGGTEQVTSHILPGMRVR